MVTSEDQPRDGAPGAPAGTGLTESERVAILFLSDKMEATARMVGYELCTKVGGPGSNLAAVGANALGRLRKRGLVMRLPELRAWRLTMEGRAMLPLKVDAGGGS